MQIFSDPTFSAKGYAAARPEYSPELYEIVMKYHDQNNANTTGTSASELCVDIGTGHGVVARVLADRFDKVIGLDPSEGMLEQATEISVKDGIKNVSFAQGTSEEMPASIEDGSVDMFVAAQAAHWFDYEKTWPLLAAKLKQGGTLAFWGYSDWVMPDHPKATEKLHALSYGPLRPYWQMPGRSIVEDRLNSIVPADKYFKDLTRVEYVPATKDMPAQGQVLVRRHMTVGSAKAYLKTFSAFHAWNAANPESSRDRPGDIADWTFEDLAKDNPIFAEPANKIWVEWGTGILMARRI